MNLEKVKEELKNQFNLYNKCFLDIDFAKRKIIKSFNFDPYPYSSINCSDFFKIFITIENLLEDEFPL